MAGKAKHIIERKGRYWARMVVPKDLRGIIGKSELREPLGSDKRAAELKVHAAMTRFLDCMESARTTLRQNNVVSLAGLPARERPQPPEMLARRHYAGELDIDERLRNAVDKKGKSILTKNSGGYRPAYAEVLKRVAAGHSSNEEAAAAVGFAIDRFRELGQTDVQSGTGEWRQLARLLAATQLEALERAGERDRGLPDGEPNLEVLRNTAEVRELKPPARIGILFDAYFREVKASGKGAQAERRWRPVIRDLQNFLKHDDARQISRRDLVGWKDELIARLNPKTVKDVYLAAIRAIFSWAVDNGHLETNPAADIKVKAGRRSRPRERGFNRSEALAVLKAAQDYKSPPSSNPRTRESTKTASAKRWTPWLAAYTGARISELTQLRKEDVLQEGEFYFLRITPAAGSVKADQYRDVPLHSHLVDIGFPAFVESSGDGPLFFEGGTKRKDGANPAEMVSGRVSKWIRSLGIIGDVAPNHGWRHRFKTIGTEERMNIRVLDAIQGHAARSAGDNYGDITLKAKRTAIEQHPRYVIT